MKWTDFLEQTPPNTAADIDDLFKPNLSVNTINSSDIQVFCDSAKCKGIRYYYPISTPTINNDYGSGEVIIKYWCRNCQLQTKIFALNISKITKGQTTGNVMKLGEFPVFGPSTPARVITLIGPDRETFLRGRRSEFHGLGIGAFAYYRRVVENQKGRLISEMGKVAKRSGAPQHILEQFEQAEKETQFTKAIEDIKAAIPEALLIEGHNPLVLLHTALSEGLHAKTDEECLELATSIRVVLTELAERISLVLKDESELQSAVKNILNRNNK